MNAITTHQNTGATHNLLGIIGSLALLASVIFLTGAFLLEDELLRAFCLGIDVTGLAGGIIVFTTMKIMGRNSTGNYRNKPV